MKGQNRKGMHTFFLESTLVLFCFSLASIVIATGFLKADVLNKEAIKKAEAMALCVEQAEFIRTLNDVEHLVDCWYYDGNWQEEQAEDATYKICLTQSEVASERAVLYSFELTVYEVDEEETPLYTLPFSHYIENNKGGDMR